MANFKQLNEVATCAFKPKICPSDLRIDVGYKILNIKKINSKFGECVIVELSDGIVYLPKRLTKEFTKEIIKALLGDKESYLIYKGNKNLGTSDKANANLFEFNSIQ